MFCRSLAVLFLAVFLLTAAEGQVRKTENIIIVTLDGLRWQEVFEGADEKIVFNDKYVDDAGDIRSFWNASAHERRLTLMPFLWNVVAHEGQLYGNRALG
ncbi:MAG TPA: phosphoglyceromutase, partial [Chryseosolibacter sp.]|nr:phosphoglyceromutase [Chryseosolibacter sp.]